MVLGGWGGGELLRWGSRAPLLFWGDGFTRKKIGKKKKIQDKEYQYQYLHLYYVLLHYQGKVLGTRYTRV